MSGLASFLCDEELRGSSVRERVGTRFLCEGEPWYKAASVRERVGMRLAGRWGDVQPSCGCCVSPWSSQ